MSNPSPLYQRHDQADAMFMPFGDDCQVVATHDIVQLEYASLRKGVGVMDCPHRALLELTGDDRLDFLHRLLTNSCSDLTQGKGTRAFMLERTGRILSDMTVLHESNRTLLDVPLHQAAAVVEALDKYIFMDDVQVRDITSRMHRLSVLGERAANLIVMADDVEANEARIDELISADDFDHTHYSIADASCIVYCDRECTSQGFQVWVPTADVERVYDRLLEAGKDIPVRCIGWMSFNIVRIESGRPWFQVDYGTDSLPHETGVLSDLVSFTKGCYTGQEVVARMESLGHAKKVVVAFRVTGSQLPASGTAITDPNTADRKVVGGVTSSTLAPMMSQMPIGFATVKWGFHEPGTKLLVPAEGTTVEIEVCELSAITRST